MPFCDETCALRGYRSQSLNEDQLSYDPYVPNASPIYSPIKAFQIRLLCLQPGALEDPIVTTLSAAVLSSEADVAILEPDNGDRFEVQYTALSYSWGYGSRTVNIICNSFEFEVLESLSIALRYLRQPDYNVYLWVDALCIQQAVQEEKNTQIQKIFSIYSKAVSTVAWIGPGSEPGNQALPVLAAYKTSVIHTEACRPGTQDLFLDLKGLSDRPWFRRTWVRQEVYASKNLSVQTDSHTLSWTKLKDVIQSLADTAARFRASGPINDTGLRRLNGRISLLLSIDPKYTLALAARELKPVKDDPMVSLDRMLRGSSNFQATDPKDYVYGVVSMTTAAVRAGTTDAGITNTPSVDHGIEPVLGIEYNQPTSKTFVDTTIHLIHYHGGLDILFWAYFCRKTPLAENIMLPSWVPDWTNLPRTSALDFVWTFIEGVRAFSTPNLSEYQWKSMDKRYIYRNRPLLIPRCNSRAFGGMRYSHIHTSGSVRSYQESGEDRLSCEGFYLGTITPDKGEPRVLDKLKGKLGISKPKEKPDPPPVLSRDVPHLPYMIGDVTKEFYNYLKSPGGGFVSCAFQPFKEALQANISYPKVRRSISPQQEEVLTSDHGGISHVKQTLHTDVSLLAPVTARQGDIVVLLRATTLPAILRPAPEAGPGHYTLVGPLIGHRFLHQEYRRHKDIGRYVIGPIGQNRPWAHLGPMKEDLALHQFILI